MNLFIFCDWLEFIFVKTAGKQIVLNMKSVCIKLIDYVTKLKKDRCLVVLFLYNIYSQPCPEVYSEAP